MSFLESHPNSSDGTSLELFADTPWSQYLRLMARNGTHGDHLTLQAAPDIFNIHIVVYSTLGATATQTISPANGCPIATFYLGHFAEGAREHYLCLADETISDRSDTEYNFLSPVHDEQSNLGSTSGLNAPGDQSQSDADQYAPDINTTHGNRTRLHENEEQDTNIQCGYEQQFNECNTDYGSFLNPDVLEKIIETTVGRYPQMRQTLRAVSRFFKRIVDNVPLPQIYIPELADVADIHHLSIRKIINIKGKNSGAVIALKKHNKC